MKEKLAGKDYLFIGSMLFGLFFGAGNLIFPIHMGQEAGAAISQANFGFLVTAVGFPFLGIIALGISQSNGVFELATRVNRIYAYIFTILLYHWSLFCTATSSNNFVRNWNFSIFI